jgi:hypothetical protein
VCAPITTGKMRDFVAKARAVNPEIGFRHGLTHREVAIAKAQFTTIFAVLYQELGYGHTSLLLHVEVRGLSRRRVLTLVLNFGNT